MARSGGIEARGLIRLAPVAGKRSRAFREPPDVLVGAHLAREVNERLRQIPARSRDIVGLERERGAEVEDTRRHRRVAQSAEEALRLVQVVAPRGAIARTPVGSSQGEGAGSGAIDIVLAGEELVVRFGDLNRAGWLFEREIRFADIVPGERPRPVRLTYLATERERLLIIGQRFPRHSHLVVESAKIHQREDLILAISYLAVQRKRLLIE